MAEERLEAYLRLAYEEDGMLHISAMQRLRRYLKRTPLPKLLAEVDAIEDLELLRILWEAGLRRELQQAVIRRLEEAGG